MKTENTKNLFYTPAEVSSEAAPVLEKKIQYLDLSKVRFLNNSIIVSLINQSKELFNKGMEVKFINVPEFLKRAIRKLGLDDILNCD